ncbi:hypothetical protein BBJ28_00011397 [Nothophytophthora sp. Chile5]|nr:hypothetical protein BBJ28_00011397 [Nothophytophthora sp. Chile5]
MDRASLVRRRQQIREKENAAVTSNTLPQSASKKVVTKRKKKEGGSRSSASNGSQSDTPSLTQTSSASQKENAGAAIAELPPPPPTKPREPSQPTKRSKAGSTAYSAEANAGLVIRQILQRSQFGDVKEYLQSATKSELFQQALIIAKSAQEVGNSVVKRIEFLYRPCGTQNNELLGRLKLAQDEYQSLITWIR